MDLGLSGCRALVTGASKGLGKACAKTLSEEGAHVFICARSTETTKEIAREVGAAGWTTADVREDL